MDLNALIRDIPDFPKPGIIFKDITPLLANPDGLRSAIATMTTPFRNQGITQVLGMESRGFLFGPSIATDLGAGFVPLRKPGKLPWQTASVSYELEYGTDSLEMHQDAISAADRVLIADDLLATGGTAAAAVELARSTGAEVIGATFLIELAFLAGRARLDGIATSAALTYS